MFALFEIVSESLSFSQLYLIVPLIFAFLTTPFFPSTSQAAEIAGYDKGFFIQSPDEKFLLKVGGYVQGQANFTSVENGGDTSDIRVRRARFKFKGHAYDPRFGYMLEFDFSNSKLFSTYAQYKHSKLIAFRIGQYKVPFNFEGSTSNSTLQFVNRSLPHVFFGISNEREPGFGLLGELAEEKLEYSVGVFTGDGLNNSNADLDFRFAGRLVFNALGKHGNKYADIFFSQEPQLAIAAGAMHNTTPQGKTLDATSDVSLKYRGLGTQASFFYRNTDLPTPGTTNDHCFMLIVGYMVLEKVEVAGRASYIVVDGNNNLGEYTGAISYYIYGNHMVKAILDYSALTTENGVAVGDDQLNHRVRAQFQVKF